MSVHTIWFVSLVPGLLGAVWIWTPLRRPRLWFSVGVLTIASTAIWLGLDLREFLATGGSSSKAGVRLIYTPLRATDLPVIPFATGCLTAGLFSILRPRPAASPYESEAGESLGLEE